MTDAQVIPLVPMCAVCACEPAVRVTLCRACAFDRAAARLGLSQHHGWATFDANELLERRVGRRGAIAEAARALDAPGLVFLGPTGSGKTSLAVAALRARMASDFDRAPRASHRFVSAIELGRARAEHRLGQPTPSLTAEAKRATVLLIDDLGAEPNFHADAIVEVVHHRHDASRTVWATTWLDADGIATRYGSGVARRLLEHATVVRCGDGR